MEAIGELLAERDRLRADVAELVGCLGIVLATREAEAKANLSYQNALDNFDNTRPEANSYARAMRAASEAEKAARALLAKHALQALADNAREMGLTYEDGSKT